MGGIHFYEGADGEFPCTMEKGEIKMRLCDSMRCELNCDMRGCFDCGVCDVKWHEGEAFDSLRDAEINVPRGRSDYEVHAVQYYYVDPRGTKKLRDLRDRASELKNRIDDAKRGEEPYFINHKSKYITCEKCGSRINVKLLNKKFRPNQCPVCDYDMRPETEMKKIDAMEIRKKELDERIEDEMKRLGRSSGNRKLCWYVKGDVYTG